MAGKRTRVIVALAPLMLVGTSVHDESLKPALNFIPNFLTVQVKKDELNIATLLRTVYILGPRERSAMFKIIDAIATDKAIPDLVARISGKDTGVRIHIINILTRFDRPDVAEAIEKQLSDPNKGVRQAALIALSHMDGDRDIARISAGRSAGKILIPPSGRLGSSRTASRIN